MATRQQREAAIDRACELVAKGYGWLGRKGGIDPEETVCVDLTKVVCWDGTVIHCLPATNKGRPEGRPSTRAR